jgi:hypothetical protein
MARTLTLRDRSGTNSVNLINTGSTGWILTRGGAGPVRVPREVMAGGRTAETYELNSRQADHDDQASALNTLMRLLYMAEDYDDGLQDEPVFLVAQTTSETNTRYATVYGAVELRYPDLYAMPFEVESEIEGFRMTIVRDGLWTSGAPGDIGTAVTLTKSNGPANAQSVHIANHRDEITVDFIKSYDDGTTTYTDITPGDDLFPAAPAVGDRLVIGGADGIPNNIVIPISAAADWSGQTLVVKYWNGSTWVAATYGEDFTIYPEPTTDESDLFETGSIDWIINWFGQSDEASVALDGDTAYWLAVEITAITSTTTVPELDETNSAYAQRVNHIEIPAASIVGDDFPLVMLRLRSPAGGDENEGPANITQVLVSARSIGLSKFVTNLNASGDDNPVDWAVAQLTDATKTADPEVPSGSKSRVDFATDSSMVARLRFTGTGMAEYWQGDFVTILRCQQVGGEPGDIRMRVRTLLGSAASEASHVDTLIKKTGGADQGYEPVDHRFLSIPFGEIYYDDDLSDVDLFFEIHVERTTGSAVLDIADLITFPTREGMWGYKAVPSADLLGSEALRGSSLLEDDMGLIAARTLKRTDIAGTLMPAETWALMHEAPQLKKIGSAYRLYFLMEHWPINGTWGVPPLISTPGMQLTGQVFLKSRHLILRGDA